ncbi:MAG: SAM-dependent methyltransferase [Muribaculum sp.]|nr:SAM-dependent methyltransferase [Muribaculum sp.]
MSENNIYHRDIMHYESEIWSCADLLISSGIKQSKFPDYMMPFFALIMLEGRMLNEIKDIEESEGLNRFDNPEEFLEAFRDKGCGYNEYIVMQGKTLASVCDNDKTFEQDFQAYLNGFDSTLKELLGIERGTEDSKYLNLDGIKAELRKKGVLMQYVTKWAQIDLSPYNNSEITTLEEHIKRKWADISAETAGEQYTPEDIISLIAEIVAAKVDISKNDYVSLYDPTCGGANLLFGVADRLRNEGGYRYVATFGQDFNDALYALAKIESLFREDSKIEYGNTLTQGRFRDKEFDVVVANPPYGIPWKGYEKEVRDDQTGQFAFYPSVTDGQLLFLQHNAHHLWQDRGIVVEVNNGSSLFSGDAGSGESNIRKYLFDKDWVEAIIQMPSDEFFNTGIVTYLWILNKAKSEERRDKVILINASELWQPLKKSKGSKRKEMNEIHRTDIVRALVNSATATLPKSMINGISISTSNRLSLLKLTRKVEVPAKASATLVNL